jgi:hypothetical protein
MKGAMIGGGVVLALFLYCFAHALLDFQNRKRRLSELHKVMHAFLVMAAIGAAIGAYIPYMLDYNRKHSSGYESGAYIGDINESDPLDMYPEGVAPPFIGESADIDCDYFLTQREAQIWLDRHPEDEDFLDADRDGWACELLP